VDPAGLTGIGPSPNQLRHARRFSSRRSKGSNSDAVSNPLAKCGTNWRGVGIWPQFPGTGTATRVQHLPSSWPDSLVQVVTPLTGMEPETDVIQNIC
jgi:hypothetical protein